MPRSVPTLALIAAFIGQFVSEGVMLSFTVLYPDLMDHFHATNAQISLVGSLAYGCWFLIGPFSGELTDRYGPVVVIMTASTIGAVGCLLTILATSLWHIIITFGVIFGTCCGLVFIPAITIVGQYFHKHHHLATTTATIGGALGGVVYPLCVQGILHLFPWQYCFTFTACLMLQVVVCGAIFHLKPDHETHLLDRCTKDDKPINSISRQRNELHNVLNPTVSDQNASIIEESSLDEQLEFEKKSSKDHQHLNSPPSNVHISGVDPSLKSTPTPHWRRNMIIFAAHNFFWNFGDFGAMTILPLYLSYQGFNTNDIALVISSYSFSTMLGRLAASCFCIWPRGDRICLYNLSTILSGTILWLFYIKSNFRMYLIYACAFGFMFGIQTALVPSVTVDLVGKDMTNSALGLAIFTSGIAGLTSPYAAGYLCDTIGDYSVTFKIASIFGIFPYFLIMHLHWPMRNGCRLM